MENLKLKLKHEDQIHFKDWLGLNLNSISWEGRYLTDFNQVWGMIFEPNILLVDQFLALKRAENLLTQGPVMSWFKWLNSKLVCFVFIHKGLTIRELQEVSGTNFSSVACILRDFFIDRLPHQEDLINENFQVGNVLSGNLDFSIEKSEMLSEHQFHGSFEGEVLIDLEVTLYSDWAKLKNKLVDDKSNYKNAQKTLKDRRFIKRQVRFLQELALLFIVGGILIFSIKLGNKAYENYLIEKISLFSPDFFWLDKNLSLKGADSRSKDDLEIQLDELNALEKIESKNSFKDIKSVTRYEVESDVVITSADTLPRDFGVADLEQSNYEEIKKGGYRNSRYGRRKAYRVMMTSVDPQRTKRKLSALLGEFNIKQVDNVKPGTSIPGGIYFNLYVPRKNLKRFLSRVGLFEKKSTILESKTNFGGPLNTNKVFIWIKTI